VRRMRPWRRPAGPCAHWTSFCAQGVGVCVCVCVCHAASDGERRFLPHCWARPTMMMVPPRRRGRGLPSCCLIQVLTALEMHAAKDCLLLAAESACHAAATESKHACLQAHSLMDPRAHYRRGDVHAAAQAADEGIQHAHALGEALPGHRHRQREEQRVDAGPALLRRQRDRHLHCLLPTCGVGWA